MDNNNDLTYHINHVVDIYLKDEIKSYEEIYDVSFYGLNLTDIFNKIEDKDHVLYSLLTMYLHIKTYTTKPFYGILPFKLGGKWYWNKKISITYLTNKDNIKIPIETHIILNEAL